MPLSSIQLLSRRSFLRRAAFGAGLLTLSRLRVAPVLAADSAAAGLQVLNPREAEILTLIVERMVDSGDPAMPAVRATRTIFTIDQALLQLDTDLQSQFRWLLPLFDWAPAVMQLKFKRFSSMNADERDDYLRAWAGSRFATCRLAFRALKNLSMLGYYSQDETWAGIHYRGPWLPRPRKVLSSEPLSARHPGLSTRERA